MKTGSSFANLTVVDLGCAFETRIVAWNTVGLKREKIALFTNNRAKTKKAVVSGAQHVYHGKSNRHIAGKKNGCDAGCKFGCSYTVGAEE